MPIAAAKEQIVQLGVSLEPMKWSPQDGDLIPRSAREAERDHDCPTRSNGSRPRSSPGRPDRAARIIIWFTSGKEDFSQVNPGDLDHIWPVGRNVRRNIFIYAS
jgi:hypothetical protein